MLAGHARRPSQPGMALLEIAPEGPDPFGGHPVLSDGRVVGLVTSGAYGHRVEKKLALAYLDSGAEAAARAGAPLTVEILGEACPAKLLTRAPYDPANARLRR